jgi:hypothetical protein
VGQVAFKSAPGAICATDGARISRNAALPAADRAMQTMNARTNERSTQGPPKPRTRAESRTSGGPRVLAAVATLAALLCSHRAWPCALSFPSARERVLTRKETALIVWDEAHRTEHFVREALFDTEARSFGFLVPVPARPVLAEARDELFARLTEWTAPKEVDTWSSSLDKGVQMTCLPQLLTMSHELDRGPSVSVLDEKRVAGLDATVLASSDVDALARWLSTRGFELRESLTRWIGRYIAKGWYIIAFRYERDGSAPALYPGEDFDGFASRAVRITFATDRPVYPYLEPDDVPSLPGRTLTLFVLSLTAMRGELADESSGSWKAQTEFSAPFDPSVLDPKLLPGVDLPSNARLNRFLDRTPKRPPSDLFFHASASVGEVRPPPLYFHHTEPVYIPVDVPIGAALALVWIWRWRARRRSRGDSS